MDEIEGMPEAPFVLGVTYLEGNIRRCTVGNSVRCGKRSLKRGENFLSMALNLLARLDGAQVRPGNLGAGILKTFAPERYQLCLMAASSRYGEGLIVVELSLLTDFDGPYPGASANVKDISKTVAYRGYEQLPIQHCGV